MTCKDFEIQAALIRSLYISITLGASKCLYLVLTEVMKSLLDCCLAFFFVRKDFEKTKLVAFLCVSWHLISAAETVSISTYLRALPDF